MERLPLEEYDPQGVKAISESARPIPGQSLTNNPDSQYPWEGPPDFTNMKDALDYIVSELLDEESYMSIISGIGQGVPVSDVTMQILYAGFKSGKWNPDLFLMLVEPVMYVLIALCEKEGVDYTLYHGEEEDDENEELLEGGTNFDRVKEVTRAKIPTKQSISAAVVPEEIKEQLEAVTIEPSLLSRPQETAEEPTSMLERQE
jgi:hypothetical protein